MAMRICNKRGVVNSFLFFLRWQLLAVLVALPGHMKFVMRGLSDRRTGVGKRARLAVRLIRAHLGVPCAHAPLELLTIVEEIITIPPTTPGQIVECGCFLGGSTAKLSWAAALVGRRLTVCDSFQGLPTVGSMDQDDNKEAFSQNDFACRLEDVRANVVRFGEPTVVDYIPGWYHETLKQFAGTDIACLFLDVDLHESIKTCLTELWKSVRPHGKVFVHDVDRSAVVAPFLDANWWSQHFQERPPTFVGKSRGLGWQRPLLGYAVKA